MVSESGVVVLLAAGRDGELEWSGGTSSCR